MAGKKQKWYVVWQGKTPGIYTSWDDCKKQVDGVEGAKYKSFESKLEAETAYSKGAPTFSTPKTSNLKPKKQSTSAIIQHSISVDAACSGNPGVMEYQGVHTQTGELLFHQKFELGTNNIGEFLGIVHGLSYQAKHGLNLPIYTDSVNAMLWVKNKKCKTKLERNARTARLFEMIERAENWLQSNKYTQPVLKWETASWGEIPADFGRK